MKIDISPGQVNSLLLGGKARFHEEKDAILSAGFALSSYIMVDETGTRHGRLALGLRRWAFMVVSLNFAAAAINSRTFGLLLRSDVP